MYKNILFLQIDQKKKDQNFFPNFIWSIGACWSIGLGDFASEHNEAQESKSRRARSRLIDLMRNYQQTDHFGPNKAFRFFISFERTTYILYTSR